SKPTNTRKLLISLLLLTKGQIASCWCHSTPAEQQAFIPIWHSIRNLNAARGQAPAERPQLRTFCRGLGADGKTSLQACQPRPRSLCGRRAGSPLPQVLAMFRHRLLPECVLELALPRAPHGRGPGVPSARAIPPLSEPAG